MRGDRTYRVRLKSGLRFEITAASVIEKNVLISPERRPDHLWEPYTTRLLVRLADTKRTVVVGGAYIGDQALPIARQIAHNGGTVYAFEPMERTFRMLKRNCVLNDIQNVVAERAALWDRSGDVLELTGPPALARTVLLADSLVEDGTSESCATTTIDRYMEAHGAMGVDLIMLDLEGGELKALQGALRELSRPADKAPDVVFEIHAHYVDWSRGVDKTDIVLYLESLGYTVFGIRDYHHCYPVPDVPTELIPVAMINTDGPPHGFNMLATKRPEGLERLGIRFVREGGPRDLSPKLLLRELHA
jgi:FkbM family methyltransferase